MELTYEDYEEYSKQIENNIKQDKMLLDTHELIYLHCKEKMSKLTKSKKDNKLVK